MCGKKTKAFDSMIDFDSNLRSKILTGTVSYRMQKYSNKDSNEKFCDRQQRNKKRMRFSNKFDSLRFFSPF